jgi:hypothetical protein
MENNEINSLLLKTAFACMACDGDIDQKEVELLRSLQREHKLFGEIDIDNHLELFLSQINENSNAFIRGYFHHLNELSLTEEMELKIIEVAISTIKADDKIEYSEIKFFKVIRSKLKIQTSKILEVHADFEEYLEQDIISSTYLAQLQDDFFQTQDKFTLGKDAFLTKDDK